MILCWPTPTATRGLLALDMLAQGAGKRREQELKQNLNIGRGCHAMPSLDLLHQGANEIWPQAKHRELGLGQSKPRSELPKAVYRLGQKYLGAFTDSFQDHQTLNRNLCE